MKTLLQCLTCDVTLSGKQSKFCSRKCKSTFQNNRHQNYQTQQRRGRERKSALVQLKGGCCEVCGYDKNQTALCFHHLNPSTKSFAIDIRHCSNTSLEILLLEVSKCQLLCLNCHAEIHNPDFST